MLDSGSLLGRAGRRICTWKIEILHILVYSAHIFLLILLKMCYTVEKNERGFASQKLQRYTGGRKMEMGSGLQVEQKQALSVGQVQSLNILALNNQELEEFFDE